MNINKNNKKKKNQNSVIDIPLFINDNKIDSINLLSELYTTVVKEIIKYLFYMRNQIKLPYNDFERLYSPITNNKDDNVEKKIIKKIPKKCMIALSSCNQLFGSLGIDFNSGNYYEKVVIIFGNSIMAPKEIYIINVPRLSHEDMLCMDDDDHHHDNNDTIDQQKTIINSIIRDIMRQLVVGQIDIFNTELKPTKIHVLVYKSNNINNNNNNNNEQIIVESLLIPNQQMEYIRKTKSTKVCVFDLNLSSSSLSTDTFTNNKMTIENNKIIIPSLLCSNRCVDTEQKSEGANGDGGDDQCKDENEGDNDDQEDMDIDIDMEIDDADEQQQLTENQHHTNVCNDIVEPFTNAYSYIWYKYNKIILFPKISSDQKNNKQKDSPNQHLDADSQSSINQTNEKGTIKLGEVNIPFSLVELELIVSDIGVGRYYSHFIHGHSSSSSSNSSTDSSRQKKEKRHQSIILLINQIKLN
ncbi:hypothetical protein DFA_11732 [Cavenderia fasciculata]|uniref:Uncharacterized protein n=1 Tax=Cavenderia fasciculata TaxID=261658 RepID=F4QE24_CACFS|nr:uncharacterized protein DFA_11732 [Cavenderia fasciculata]EGG13971.1 hypothetical protein DFA_11732 [Cavenderia fasciculata]|eukprot:XP_004350679.1 hypothetical protein DFA_11732 [Cavenderia fasciculata]